MTTEAMEHDPVRRRRVRRTLWIAGSLAVAFFVLSIVNMLKIG